MNILLDAMGGDNAPDANIKGAVKAINQIKADVTLIGKEELAIMKDGSYLINCARGKVVDEEALLEALESGKIAGAGIDVFEVEPNTNEALVNHPRVSCTPHIGASTIEAQERIGDEVVTIIKEFFN